MRSKRLITHEIAFHQHKPFQPADTLDLIALCIWIAVSRYKGFTPLNYAEINLIGPQINSMNVIIENQNELSKLFVQNSYKC